MLKKAELRKWDTETTVTPETGITWKVTTNPKRPHGKSFARMADYMKAETVMEYHLLGGSRGDLKYDWEHKYFDFK